MPRRKSTAAIAPAPVAEPAITEPATLVPPLGPNPAPPDHPQAIVAAAEALQAEPPSPYAARREEATARTQALLDRIFAHHLDVKYETPEGERGVVDLARELFVVALTREHHVCSSCGHDDGPRVHQDEALARELEIRCQLLNLDFQAACTKRDLAGLEALHRMAVAPSRPAPAPAPVPNRAVRRQQKKGAVPVMIGSWSRRAG